MELKTMQFAKKSEGSEVLDLVGGDIFKIETNLIDGGGQEILIDTVPAGKRRRYSLQLTIEEEDV